jgi:hypothetical protein
VDDERPIVIAHRAGNELARLDEARRSGVDLVEADVHLFHGRLEVRHAKTVGPIPLLWDRWELPSPWSPRLLLGDLLDAAAGVHLLLDLKGRHRRLPGKIVDALHAHGVERASICARWWPYLDELEALDGLDGIDLIYSAGSIRQVERLRRHRHGRRLHGVSVHAKTLDTERVRALRDMADLVVTWPINDAATAERVLALGVNGLITDDLDLARRWIDGRTGERPDGRDDHEAPDPTGA